MRGYLNGARNGDRTNIVTDVIEQRGRETVHALQHPVRGGGPTARSDFRDGALERAWRANRLWSPGFERSRKAVLHENFGAECQSDVAVSAGMEIEYGSGLRPEIHDCVPL